MGDAIMEIKKMLDKDFLVCAWKITHFLFDSHPVHMEVEIIRLFMDPPLGGVGKGVVAFFFGNSQRKMPPPLFDPPRGDP